MFTLNMELRTAAVFFRLVCAIIIITTTEGFIPKCCLETSAMINTRILKTAQKYDVQSDTGPCEVKALVLHVGKQRLCLDPKTERMVKRWMMKKKKKRNGHAQKQKKTVKTFS